MLKKILTKATAAILALTTFCGSAITSSAVGMVNATAGSATIITGGSGNSDTSWSTPLAGANMWGFRVAVYWSERVGFDANGEPIYAWQTIGENGLDQIGKTVDIRTDLIEFSGSKGNYTVLPSMFGYNAFEHTIKKEKNTIDKLMFQNINDNEYSYAVINNDYLSASFKASMDSEYNDLMNMLESARTSNPAAFANSANIVNAYNRMKKIGSVSSDGTYKLNSYDLTLPFTPNMNQGPASSTANSKYELQTYFIHPTVLNLISSYTSGNENGVGEWSDEDFYMGIYQGNEGQYKISVEPIQYRLYKNGALTACTWQDYVMDYNNVGNDGFIYNAGPTATTQFANAVMLADGEPILKFPDVSGYMGDLLDNDVPVKPYDGLTNTLTSNDPAGNYLGVGIITSASIGSYNESDVIIKYIEKATGKQIGETVGVTADNTGFFTGMLVSPKNYAIVSWERKSQDENDKTVYASDEAEVDEVLWGPRLIYEGKVTPEIPKQVIYAYCVPAKDGELVVEYIDTKTKAVLATNTVTGIKVVAAPVYRDEYLTPPTGYSLLRWDLYGGVTPIVDTPENREYLVKQYDSTTGDCVLEMAQIAFGEYSYIKYLAVECISDDDKNKNNVTVICVDENGKELIPPEVIYTPDDIVNVTPPDIPGYVPIDYTIDNEPEKDIPVSGIPVPFPPEDREVKITYTDPDNANGVTVICKDDTGKELIPPKNVYTIKSEIDVAPPSIPGYVPVEYTIDNGTSQDIPGTNIPVSFPPPRRVVVITYVDPDKANKVTVICEDEDGDELIPPDIIYTIKDVVDVTPPDIPGYIPDDYTIDNGPERDIPDGKIPVPFPPRERVVKIKYIDPNNRISYELKVHHMLWNNTISDYEDKYVDTYEVPAFNSVRTEYPANFDGYHYEHYEIYGFAEDQTASPVTSPIVFNMVGNTQLYIYYNLIEDEDIDVICADNTSKFEFDLGLIYKHDHNQNGKTYLCKHSIEGEVSLTGFNNWKIADDAGRNPFHSGYGFDFGDNSTITLDVDIDEVLTLSKKSLSSNCDIEAADIGSITVHPPTIKVHLPFTTVGMGEFAGKVQPNVITLKCEHVSGKKYRYTIPDSNITYKGAPAYNQIITPVSLADGTYKVILEYTGVATTIYNGNTDKYEEIEWCGSKELSFKIQGNMYEDDYNTMWW